jgi:hypothetical protein
MAKQNPNPIDRLIEAKEARIANAEKGIGKLKIEIAALREAREAMTGAPAEGSNGVAAPRSATGNRKGRSLSAQWKQVLADIAKKGSEGADLDEIERFCRQRGIDLKRPTLRAQMSNYVKRAYLGRNENGKFFIALNGLTVAGLNPLEGNQRIPGDVGKKAGTLY